MEDKTNTLIAEMEMYEHCLGTELNNKRIEREGKFAFFRGSRTPSWLFIGEAPGKNEDIEGVPFIGRAGKLLSKWIVENDLENYAIINSVPIMPTNEKGGIRKPTIKELSYFNEKFMKMIEQLNPDNIILLGRSAESAYLGKKGKHLMKESEKCYNVGYIHHPAYYIRRGQDGCKAFRELIKKMEKGFEG